jgi:hypothetical protein
MRTWNLTCLATLSIALATCGLARAADGDIDVKQYTNTLKEAKVATDGKGLLAYFRSRTLTEEDKAKLAGLVRKLGDELFKVREQAGRDLQAAGRAAVPFLRAAVNDPDLEIAKRSRRILESILEGAELPITAAAAYVLADRKPDGALEALLAYIPFAGDDSVEEAVRTAVVKLGVRGGKADDKLMAALADKDTVRRAAAAFAVGKATGEQRQSLTKLFKDSEARVRFEAASALVPAGEKSAVPVICALLDDGPAALAWQAEDLLFRVAGERAPKATLGTGEMASRKKARETWEDWWKKNAAKIDLAKINLEEAQLGINLIAELGGNNGGQGRVWACGNDGKSRWSIDCMGPVDARLLRGGRVLIAEHHGQRVTERDQKGKVLWETKLNNSPVSCQRLTNGNTFIATYNEICEVSRDGKKVYTHNMNNNMLFWAEKLRNGNILYVGSNNQIVEMSTAGKEVRTVSLANTGGTGGWAGVDPLPNGHYVVALYGSQKVVEVDASGKVVWEKGGVQNPTYAMRLRNGNVLATSTNNQLLIEYDRAGKEVWKQQTTGRPFRVRRY